MKTFADLALHGCHLLRCCWPRCWRSRLRQQLGEGDQHRHGRRGDRRGRAAREPAARVICTVAGAACTANAECCSQSCDPVAQTCASSVTTCSGAGSSCAVDTDCCNLQCDTSAQRLRQRHQLHRRQRDLHDRGRLLQRHLRRRQVPAAQHRLPDRRQPLRRARRRRRRLLLGPLHGRHVRARLVVLHPAGRRLRARRRLLRRLLLEGRGREPGRLHGRRDDRHRQLRARRRPLQRLRQLLQQELRPLGADRGERLPAGPGLQDPQQPVHQRQPVLRRHGAARSPARPPPAAT